MRNRVLVYIECLYSWLIRRVCSSFEMPTFCSAYSCTNANDKESCREKKISFYRFPIRDKNLLEKWLRNIKRENFVPNAGTKICSEHFEENCFEYNRFSKRRYLKKDAIPTKFSFSPLKNSRKRTSYVGIDMESEISFLEVNDERPRLWEIQLPQNSQATKISKLSSDHFTDDTGAWLKNTTISTNFDFPDHLKESEQKSNSNMRLSLSSEDSKDGQSDETSEKEPNTLKPKRLIKEECEELSIIKQIEDDIRKEFLDEMERTVQNSEIPKDEDDELLTVQLELNQAYTEINILRRTKEMIAKELSAAFKNQKFLINNLIKKEGELSRMKLELEQANAEISVLSAEKYSFVEKLEMALSNQKILEKMMSEKPILEENLKQAFAEIDALRKERDELLEKQTAADATKGILQDPNKLCYYTGLKAVEDFFSLLMLLDKFKNEGNNVPIETKFLIILMRLQGHYKYSDLAFRFDISAGTISRVCDKIIPFLGRKLEDLINNSTQDESNKNLPVDSKITVYENILQKIQKYSKVENKKFWSEV